MTTGPFSLSLALGSGSAAAFAELTGAGYARQTINFGPAVNGTIFNLSGITFSATGTWPGATQYGLFDASGNLDLWWNKKNPATLAAGQTHTLDKGAISIFLPDVAQWRGATLLQWPGGALVGSVGGTPVYTGPDGTAWNPS
jgi:hypothetical protein